MSRCFVEGKPVRTLHLQVRGGPAFLVTEDAGTHECTRLYYSPSQFGKKETVFKCGNGDDRLGQSMIAKAEFKRAEGLTITMTDGTVMFIHTQWVAGNWQY